MSDHKKTQFKYFSKEDMDKGLSLHRLPTDTPSQLADSFRAGAQWAVAQYLGTLMSVLQTTIDKCPKDGPNHVTRRTQKHNPTPGARLFITNFGCIELLRDKEELDFTDFTFRGINEVDKGLNPVDAADAVINYLNLQIEKVDLIESRNLTKRTKPMRVVDFGKLYEKDGMLHMRNFRFEEIGDQEIDEPEIKVCLRAIVDYLQEEKKNQTA